MATNCVTNSPTTPSVKLTLSIVCTARGSLTKSRTRVTPDLSPVTAIRNAFFPVLPMARLLFEIALRMVPGGRFHSKESCGARLRHFGVTLSSSSETSSD